MALQHHEETSQTVPTDQAPNPFEPPLFRCEVPARGLGVLLVRIAERRLSGRLVFANEQAERLVFFAAGFPVFAQSSLFSERIGAVGVRHGLFDQDDVNAALQIAGAEQQELGCALLEQRSLDGAQLFSLLGAQLLEQLTSACSEPQGTALFVADPTSVDRVAVLRMHPMAPILAAVRALPERDRKRVLSTASAWRIACKPLATTASKWLADLGYMGDPTTLLGSRMTIGALRSRLVARIRPASRSILDAPSGPLADNRAEPSTPMNGHCLAELVTLTLLLSGTIELEEPDKRRTALETDGNRNAAIDAVLAAGDPTRTSKVPAGPDAEPGPVASAIDDYLHGKRHGRLAGLLAVWGAGAEAREVSTDLNQLLMLYLTVKSAHRPGTMLALTEDATPETAADYHMRYSNFLASLAEEDDSPLLGCKIAEIQARLDWALEQLDSSVIDDEGEAGTPLQSDRVPARHRSNGASPDFSDSEEALQALRPPGVPDSTVSSDSEAEAGGTNIAQPTAEGQRPSVEEVEAAQPHGALPDATLTDEGLAERVSAWFSACEWSTAREALAERKEGGPMPAILQVALAVAQREEARAEMDGTRAGTNAWPVWILVGTAVGFAVRHFQLVDALSGLATHGR